MRPIYETSYDLDKENSFITDISKRWKITFYKLPISYKFDYMLGNPCKGFMETKIRNIRINDYPDIMLSMSKYERGLQLLRYGKVYFAVRLKDADYYYEFKSEKSMSIMWGGRTKNTRDSADIEPVIHIPCNEFIKIKK